MEFFSFKKSLNVNGKSLPNGNGYSHSNGNGISNGNGLSNGNGNSNGNGHHITKPKIVQPSNFV